MEFQKYKDAKTAVTQSIVYREEFNAWKRWRTAPLLKLGVFISVELELTESGGFPPINLVTSVCILF